MTEAEERKRGRRDVRLSMLPHYPSSPLLFPPLPSLPLAPPFPPPLCPLPSPSSLPSSCCSSLTLPSSSASLTPSVSSHHLIGRLPGTVLIFVPSNTCHKHTNKHKQWFHSVCVFVCRGELSVPSRCWLWRPVCPLNGAALLEEAKEGKWRKKRLLAGNKLIRSRVAGAASAASEQWKPSKEKHFAVHCFFLYRKNPTF